ncbi:hypothetical protein [Segetibacter koreensis]|uniref:hypothetical protein n=1 Tax=Segetibacter koreensis TaxID=398037 RepID=UPI000381A3B5|nr:hypothetical protein [Segetibacter koreensis]
MKLLNLHGLFQLLLDWSEVWAIVIPLFIVLIVRRKQPFFLKPVIVYLWAALIINVLADLIADFKSFLPHWAQSNNPLYNIHSIARFVCFSYFFISIKKSQITFLKKLIPFLLAVFTIINFSFFENFFNPIHLSGNLLTIESYLLLIYCMQYYLSQLRDEVERISSGKEFWIVTGLSIYVVINFFLFLFYEPMIKGSPALAAQMWNVHNIAYIIFCILIAKAFYATDSN